MKPSKMLSQEPRMELWIAIQRLAVCRRIRAIGLSGDLLSDLINSLLGGTTSVLARTTARAWSRR
jgi:hypothetical protein